jgi:hypothetical protein
MMPTLSFSGTTSRGPFWLTLGQHKHTTIRKPRKHTLHVGDDVHLYWKQRVPIRQKITHFIGYARIAKIERVLFKDIAFDDAIAQRDGYQNATELRQRLHTLYGPTLTHDEHAEFDIIHLTGIVKVDEGRLDTY